MPNYDKYSPYRKRKNPAEEKKQDPKLKPRPLREKPDETGKK